MAFEIEIRILFMHHMPTFLPFALFFEISCKRIISAKEKSGKIKITYYT